MEYRALQKKQEKPPPSFEKGDIVRRVRTSPGSVSQDLALSSLLLKLPGDEDDKQMQFLEPRTSRELGSGPIKVHHPRPSRPRSVSWTEDSLRSPQQNFIKSNLHERPTPSIHNNNTRLRMRANALSNPFVPENQVHQPTYNSVDLALARPSLARHDSPSPPSPQATLEIVPTMPPPCVPRNEDDARTNENVPARVLLPDF